MCVCVCVHIYAHTGSHLSTAHKHTHTHCKWDIRASVEFIYGGFLVTAAGDTLIFLEERSLDSKFPQAHCFIQYARSDREGRTVQMVLYLRHVRNWLGCTLNMHTGLFKTNHLERIQRLYLHRSDASALAQ